MTYILHFLWNIFIYIDTYIFYVSIGVGVMEDCAIKAVHSKDGRVSGVATTHGSIECQYFVNCAGFWARQVRQ